MWMVEYTRASQRQISKLPFSARSALGVLINAIKNSGPVRGDWPNYGKLAGNRHHCHFKKGHPTYVAVWEEVESKIKIARILYAGTHEDAPY